MSRCSDPEVVLISEVKVVNDNPLDKEEELKKDEQNRVNGGGDTIQEEELLQEQIKGPPTDSMDVRSCLNVENASSSFGDGVVAVADGCGAVMEVIRTSADRWAVVRFMAEHIHPLTPLPLPDFSGSLGGTFPVVGMEFESISMAKAFYQSYREKMGFKARTGVGRRSPDNRTLIMQRFFCSKGSYPTPKRHPSLQEGAGKSTRYSMPLRKIMPKPAKDGEEEGILVNSPARISACFEEKDSGSCSLGGKLKEVGRIPLVSNPGQSRLLRELGIRVSRYTHEERRDIITRYMKKRSSRQVVDRSRKIPSRQALAERRQRGVGGKFLSKEDVEVQNTAGPEEIVVEEPDVPPADEFANSGGVPIVGMMFENEEKAYEYYVKYAADAGFSVRKGWWDKTSKNITRSRVFVCSKEGFRTKNEEAKKSRPETRTGCPARMTVKVTSSKKYRVTEFVSDHNHLLAAPLDIQMLTSKKILTKTTVGGQSSVSLIPDGCKNYIRSKRMKPMEPRDVGDILRYMQKKKGDDPSFYYSIQVDENDQIANVFWADMKSVMDYYYFGDVICFDTSCKVNEFGRPLALFLGVNHHSQVIVFGAVLMFDETVESFKWLFESFKTAMCGRQPKTILIDPNPAIVEALASVWLETRHRLSIWHLHQTALHVLIDYFQGSETFKDDFGRCLYEVEEEEFHSAWNGLIEKYSLQSNEWLSRLYNEKEKWSLVYSREMFCADMDSILMQSESLSHSLKEYLRSETDLLFFFKAYDRLLNDRRSVEVQCDHEANQIAPRIAPLRLLWQTANAYTPASFAMFQREFDLFVHCMIFSCTETGMLSDYEVLIKEKSKAQFVRFDSSDGSVTCSCRKFESVGVLCCHVLKVLDFRNIKELPPKYILKRWRKDAKVGITLEDVTAEASVTKLPLLHRYNSLCRGFLKIAARAAESREGFILMLSQSDHLLEQVERLLRARLLEKPSQSSNSKSRSHRLVESEAPLHESNHENQKTNGRKKNGVIRRYEQEMNKRKKARNGNEQPEELEVSVRQSEAPMLANGVAIQPRIPSNQFLGPNLFMQGPYVASHQFGLNNVPHGFYSTTQFNQDSSAVGLHQSQFHGGAALNQATVPSFSTLDMHALPFVGANPQLDQRSGDQGHRVIPVWDFL